MGGIVGTHLRLAGWSAVRPVALLAIVLVLSAAACSGSDEAAKPTATTGTTRAKSERPPLAAGSRGRTYTVTQVERRFSTVTRLPVVRFADASTPDVTSLRTRPHETDRFGEFQLFVFRPAASRRMTRTFTHGARANAQGIYWVPDQAGGWIAVTLHGRNLALGWFPTQYGAHAVDARWARLQAAVKRIL
jgi:hypothetical protein